MPVPGLWHVATSHGVANAAAVLAYALIAGCVAVVLWRSPGVRQLRATAKWALRRGSGRQLPQRVKFPPRPAAPLTAYERHVLNVTEHNLGQIGSEGGPQ
jgi:hypothetical protein